jgi:hypothetical protein
MNFRGNRHFVSIQPLGGTRIYRGPDGRMVGAAAFTPMMRKM